MITAAISALLGVVTMFAIKEPERGVFLTEKQKAIEVEKKAKKQREHAE